MDIIINDFDILSTLLPKSICLIIGDTHSGKSTLIKDIIVNIYDTYPIGNICTDSSHFNNFYSKFLNIKCIYKRYSTILETRCFQHNSYLIIDNYFYSIEKYNEIFHNCYDKNILLLVSLSKFTDFTDYNYIFICKFTDNSQLEKIFCLYIKKFDFNFEQFIKIVISCTYDYDVLIINCTANGLTDLFFSYIADLNETFCTIDD